MNIKINVHFKSKDEELMLDFSIYLINGPYFSFWLMFNYSRYRNLPQNWILNKKTSEKILKEHQISMVIFKSKDEELMLDFSIYLINGPYFLFW